jgi:hypothetical protein
MRGAVRHRAGGEEVQGRRRWLLRGLPVSGLSVCLHTISSPRQWVVCLSPCRIIASCAAAPSSRTKSSDDCGGASERERGGGRRGGRRGAAAAAGAVRGEREATGGDGETAPIWITLSHRMLAPRHRGETTSATARLEHRTRGRGGRRRRRRRRRWRWRWRWRGERGDRGEEELTGLACRRAGR